MNILRQRPMAEMPRCVNRDVAGSNDVWDTHGNRPPRRREYILNAPANCNLMVYMARNSPCKRAEVKFVSIPPSWFCSVKGILVEVAVGLWFLQRKCYLQYSWAGGIARPTGDKRLIQRNEEALSGQASGGMLKLRWISLE